MVGKTHNKCLMHFIPNARNVPRPLLNLLMKTGPGCPGPVCFWHLIGNRPSVQAKPLAAGGATLALNLAWR